MSLTSKQRAALVFIIDHQAKHGICPNYQEIADGLGLRAKSNIHRIVSALEERGYIRKPSQQRARSLTVLRLPADMEMRCSECGAPMQAVESEAAA